MKTLLVAASLFFAQAADAACPPLLDFRVKDIDGATQDLCAHARYRAQGRVVLGFPANDFFGQESGSEHEIKAFCETRYEVDSPLFSRVSVKKGRAQPLHEALYEATGERPGWNFHPHLIDRSGAQARSFGTRVDPESPEFENTIRRLLQADAGAAR